MSSGQGQRRSLLTVEGLDVAFGSGARAVPAVRDVWLTLERGECLAVVGESGSGKSVTVRTLVGLAGARSRVSAGRLDFDGQDLLALGERGWRAVRGRRIGLVLQDAMVSLDPLRTVGAEVREALRTHATVPRAELGPAVLSLLADVGIPDPPRVAGLHPHQLSGGLRQRALIASAIAAKPDLLLADEPTTALDVTVQARIFELLAGLVEGGTAVLLISHDLAVVSRLADRICVMYAGRIVEEGPATAVLQDPQHPYTRALLAAAPSLHSKGTLLGRPVATRAPEGPGGCPYARHCELADDRCRQTLPPRARRDTQQTLCWYPGRRPPRPQPPSRPAAVSAVSAGPAAVSDGSSESALTFEVTPSLLLEVDGVSKRFRRPDGGDHHALRGVSLDVRPGETLGLVGESGSGKTTLARIVLGLESPDAGTVRFAGAAWSELPERERRLRRPQLQVISQDPLGSFDPRFTVEDLIGEALARVGVARGNARRSRVVRLLDQVGLPASVLGSRPRNLSGGQRQRVAIARALAPAPQLLICDEPVSALDVSIQAQVLDLLVAVQRDLGVALLFISHDLGVIHHISDRLVVMKDGLVIETGSTEEVFARPVAAYTQQLLAAVPTPAPAIGTATR